MLNTVVFPGTTIQLSSKGIRFSFAIIIAYILKCKEFANLVQKFVLGKKFNQNVADFEDDEVLVPIKELLVVCLNNTPGSYGVGRDNTNYKLYYLIFTNIFFFTIEGKEQEEARNKDDPCKS